MRALRFRIACFAVVLLAGQAALLAIPPASLTLAPASDCECPGETAGQACPMHHSPNPDDRGPGPAMHGTCSPDDAGLLSLGLGLGVLSDVRQRGAEPVSLAESSPARYRIGLAPRPDPTPPRA